MTRLAALSLALAATLALPAPAAACRCATMSYKRARARADAIFTGKLMHVEKLPNGRFAHLRFAVDRVYKGTLSKRTDIMPGRTSCSITRFMVEEGTRYLAYAVRREQGLVVRKCFRLAPASSRQARRDLRRLGKGSPPRQGR